MLHQRSAFLRAQRLPAEGVAACVVALVGLCVLLWMLLPAVRPAQVAPLTSETRAWSQLALAQTTPREFVLPITFAPPGQFARLDHVAIPISVSGHALPMDAATMTFHGTSCSLEATPQVVTDGELVAFRPVDCAEVAPSASPMEGVLRIRLGAHGTAALLVAEEDAALRAVGPEGPGASLLGLWVERPSGEAVSRAARLAHMWTLPWLHWGSALVAVLAAVLTAIGGFLARRRAPWAVGAWALAAGVCFAVFTPPLQAPDEPDHVLSYLRLAEREDLQDDAAALAQTSHFERIRFHRWERFEPRHMEAPFHTPWTEVSESGVIEVADSLMESRSALTTWAWRGPLAVFTEFGAAGAMLALRLTNAALWAGACLLGACLLQRADRVHIFPLFLFAAPSLAFFAIHISNYAHLTQAAVVGGCLQLALFARGRRWDAAGLGVGLLAAMLLLTSKSAVALMAWPLCLALGRLWAASMEDLPEAHGARFSWRRQLRRSGLFWGGAALGLTPLLLAVGSEQFATLGGRGEAVFVTLLGPDAAWLASAWCVAGLLLGVLAACWLVEAALVRLAAGGLGRVGRASRVVAVAATALLAAAQGTALLYTGFQALSKTPNEAHLGGTPLVEFLTVALHGFLTMLTFREPDVLLSTTFWSGFGWHDALFAEPIVAVIAGTAGVGLFLTAWRTLRAGGPSDAASHAMRSMQSARLVAGLLGATASGVAAAYAVFFMAEATGLPNVHGRYLIGVYVAALSLALAGFAPWRRETHRIDSVGNSAHTPLPPPDASRVGLALEVWLVFAAGVAAPAAAFWLSFPHVFPTVAIPYYYLYLGMVTGFPLAGRVMQRTAAVGRQPWPAPRPWALLVVAVAAFGAIATAELGWGLPWVMAKYPLGFYVILALVCATGALWVLLKPRFGGLGRWLAPAGIVVLAAGHLAVHVFLLYRYFG